MISTLDLLYIVLAVCALVLTVVITMIGVEVFHVVRDVRRISDNVENIAGLVHRLVRIVIPGMEKTARDMADVEDRVHGFFARWLSRKEPSGRKKG